MAEDRSVNDSSVTTWLATEFTSASTGKAIPGSEWLWTPESFVRTLVDVACYAKAPVKPIPTYVRGGGYRGEVGRRDRGGGPPMLRALRGVQAQPLVVGVLRRACACLVL